MFGEKHLAHFSQTIVAMPVATTRADEQMQV